MEVALHSVTPLFDFFSARSAAAFSHRRNSSVQLSMAARILECLSLNYFAGLRSMVKLSFY